MIDDIDKAINIAITGDNKQQAKPSTANNYSSIDDAIDLTIENEKTEYVDSMFGGVPKYEAYMKKTYGDDVFKASDELRNRKRVEQKLDMLVKFDKTPDELIALKDKAKALNMKPSQLLDLTPETEQIINEAIAKNNIIVDYSLNTPVTYSMLDNAIDAKIGIGSFQNMQMIEDRFRRQQARAEKEKMEKIQSRGLIDNFYYGMGQMGVLGRRLRYFASDNIDGAVQGVSNLFVDDDTRMFTDAMRSNRQEARYKSIIGMAQHVETFEHDLRSGEFVKEYDENGLGSSLLYLAKNPTLMSSFLAQSAPSIVSAGPVGKMAGGILATGLERTALNTAVKGYLMKAGTLSTIGGASTAGMSYQQNVNQGYQKTGDLNKTIAYADKRTAVDSAFGAVGGMLPFFSKGGTWAGRSLNIFTEGTAQGIAGSAGAYYSAKSVGEEVTGGEMALNFMMGYLTAPVDIVMAGYSRGKKFDESVRADLQTASDIINDVKTMDLTGKDPELVRETIKKIKEQSEDGIQDVYIPAEEFARYFQEQGIDAAELADKVTGKQGALDDALIAGTDLQIPVENYAIDIAAKGHDVAFSETYRTAPESMSISELTEFDSQLIQSTEHLAKEIDKAIKESSAILNDNKIYDNVVNQLKEAGVDKASAERQALLYQSFFNTLGQRLGIDPVGIFEKYNLSIGRDFKIGQESLKSFSDTKANGFIDIGKDGSVKIGLTENANLSTFLHESGHFYLEVLGDISQIDNIPDQIKGDYNTIRKWLGADGDKPLTVKQHEKFARGFEAYLMEGKAPSIELQSAFTRFKAWLTQIYKVAKNLNVKLNDDVRRVFDRMLATDDAIEVARAPYKEVFSTAEQAGMSTKEFAIYKETATKANEAAKEKLLNNALAEIKREQTKEYREARQEIKQGVINELQNEPIYILDDFLRKGVDADGQQVLAIQKLDTESIKSIYGDDIAKQLKPFMQEGGLQPDIVAEMFGFNSTDEMVQQLANKPTNQAMINIETKARLTERFGDILLDGTLADKAIQSVETEGRAKVLEAELKAINKQRKIADRVAKLKVDDTQKAHKEAQVQAKREQREADKADAQAKREAFDSITPEKILREASRQVISNSTVKDIKPHLYLSAERKANKKAFDAVQKGDWETAARAKEQERLNHFLYLEALKALEVSDKIAKYANSFNKTSKRERINKVSKDGLEQIDAILEQYEFKKVSNTQIERKQNLRNYIDELAANGIDPDIPEFIMDNARQINYKELSFEQLQAVQDSLKAIETVSRLKNKLIGNQKQRDFAEFKEEALRSFEENMPVDAKGKATSKLSESMPDKALNTLSKVTNVNIANVISFCYRADGGRADGILSSSIYRPIAEAEVKMKAMMQGASKVFDDILNGVSGKHFKEKTAINSLGGYMIAKGEAIMIALNCGNASNKSRLLKGGIKTKDSVRALPLSEQAITEILGTLNQKDWELVQSVWQQFENMKPEAKELYRTLNGTEFKEIEAGTIDTKFGEIQGGYFPLEYDHDVADVPSAITNKTLFNKGRKSAMPSNGYTKAREEKVTGTVNLDLNLVPNKLSEHILDITHRKALIDANKILIDPEISAALKQKLGVDSYNAIFKSIYDLANANQDRGFGAWLGNLNKNAATYYLGASLQTMINQIPGIFELFHYVNLLDYSKEAASTIGNYNDNLKFIMDNSVVMADRWQKTDYSRTALNKLKGSGKASVAFEKIKTFALAYMPVFERVFSVPAWMAIYKREMASGNTHEKAVMQADAAIIKTQGGFLNIDKNEYQRNKAISAFYVFASPFISSHNTTMDAMFVAKQGKSTYKKEIAKRLAIISMASFGYSLIAGQKDDKEGYGEFATKSMLSYASAGVPILRDVVNLVNGGYGRSAMSTPAASTIGNAIQETKRLKDPENIKIDRTLAAFAAITGAPVKPITVQGAAIKDLITGDYRPDGALDAIRHLLYRKNKPR